MEHANNALSPIFDKEKEQKRLQTAQMVGELGSQVMDVIRTEGEIRATRAAEASGKVDRPADNASDAAWDKYRKDLTETADYKAVMASYGTGSDLQRAAQAATAAIQSLAGGGNLQQALAGASAPYLAQLVKSATMPADERKATASDIAANAMGHALMGAVVAQLSGKDAVAGAVGAAGGELTARLLIMKELYGGRDTSDLTEAEKQSVSALASLAAGLASGIASGSVEGAATGAQAGRNAVENNSLSDGFSLPSGLQSYGAAATSLDNYLAQNGASVDERIKAQSNLVNGVGPSIGDEYKISPTAKVEGASGIGLGVFAEGVVDKDKFVLNGGFSPTFGLRGGATVGFDFGPYLPGVISTNKDYSIDVGLAIGSLGITSGKDGVGFSIGVGPSIGWSGFSKEIKGVDVDGNGKVGKEIYKHEFNKAGK
ncbi:hypothetical protein OS31_49050 [Dickeya oryzae]